MLFCIDAHAIGRRQTGNETYVRNLLANYAELDPESEFVALISELGAAELVPAHVGVETVSNNPYLRLGWQMARVAARRQADVLHVQYTAPLGCRVPVVATVHDVSFVEHPEFFPSARVFQLRQTVPATIRAAKRVLAPSEFSAKRIREVYGVAEDKIVVVPNGVSPFFAPQGSAQREKERREFPGAPFLLTVGDLQPRKNQVGLIEAFERLIAGNPLFPHHLVLAGKESWRGRDVRARAQRSPLRDRIHFAGFVSDETLLRLYNACDLFVFPSLYEGFGIPILEAMACGRAVACSNTTATAEVADGAALTFDPKSPESIAQSLAELLLNGDLRQRLERMGQARAARFRWEDAARKTLETYYQVVGAPCAHLAGVGATS
jgi:glycosyltransferase involved in cell wall biosynthesis